MRDTPKHEMRRDAPAKLFSTGDVSEGPISVKIIEEKDDRLVFDLMNCDAPIANAFRRIMIAEVPTIAIETVLIAMNTSIIQDEVLAHRLGLVPLNVDPESLQENEKLTFRLDFKCKKNGEQNIYSRDLKWVPDDDLNQSERLSPAPATIHDDILIAKLAPGQVIELEMVCVKGIGKDHAKFSPVCTASYRAMPEIQILREGFDDESKKEEYEKLVSCCPMNVFDIEDIGGEPQAVVANPRRCTMCRECIRAPGMEHKVKLLRKSNHFVFTVETVGAISPADIFKRSLDVLAEKCKTILQELKSKSG